jgi:ABC-type transport system substrate-binding protein
MTGTGYMRTWMAALACGLALHAVVPAAHAKPDPAKVLRVAFEGADDGFDLVRSNSNLYSTWVAQAIFETLLTYDYLARPVRLVPGTAEAMPEISADGKTYVFRIRKGIYFSPDPVFKGGKRELTAADYVYTIKRILDPKNRSSQAGAFEGKIVGMDEAVAAAKESGKFDYVKPVAGLEATDRHTLTIRLTAPDQTFDLLLTHATAAAVALEVIDHYGTESGMHPVGTGPYMLTQYVPRSKVALEANPHYRGFAWDFKPSGDKWDEHVIKEMNGKQMPRIGRVEVAIIEEEQSRWLAFSSGQMDLDRIPDTAVRNAMEKGRLKPEFAARGIRHYALVNPDVVRTFFNFRDPMVGGYSKEKIALRRAIAMSYNVEEEITQVRIGQAVKVHSRVPAGVLGHDPTYRRSIAYDPDLANRLLDHFGYSKGTDGFRNQPDGKPLVIRIHSAPTSRDQTMMEIWKRSLSKLSLRTEFPVSSFADNLKAASRCEIMMASFGGTASIPDGSDFLDVYYGPNAGQGNLGCYQSEAYDALYQKARLLSDGPERQAIYTQMFRQLEADTVEVTQVSRIRNWLAHPWVKGYKQHPFMYNNWMYLDIEK